MKIRNPKCPECGQIAIGKVLQTKNTARIEFYEQNAFCFTGHIFTDHDSTRAVVGKNGYSILTCSSGHEWEAAPI